MPRTPEARETAAAPPRLTRRARLRQAFPPLPAVPLTAVYLFVLVVTSYLVRELPPATVHRILFDSSTNLHQLAVDPLGVLVASAFWISNGHVTPWLVLLGVVGGYAELRVGTLRAFLVFLAGHAGASLLVAAGLTVGVITGIAHPSIGMMIDVGPSYGFAALAAAMIVLCPPRLRWCATFVLVDWLVMGWTNGIGVSAVGHLLAACIGVGCGALLSARDSRPAPGTSRSWPSPVSVNSEMFGESRRPVNA